MVHQLFVDFKKAYDSVRRKALYNVRIEFGIPMQIDSLIKMCLNETYSKIRIGKLSSDNKNAIFWDVTLFGSCKNQLFAGI
jgi:hypothetical protein